MLAAGSGHELDPVEGDGGAGVGGAFVGLEAEQQRPWRQVDAPREPKVALVAAHSEHRKSL